MTALIAGTLLVTTDGRSSPLPGEIGMGALHSNALKATLHYSIAPM